MTVIWKKLNSWMTVPSADPDDARRRRFLNIILAGSIVLSSVLLFLLVWFWFTTPRETWIAQGNNVILSVTFAILVGSILLFILNRFMRGWLAGALFLVLMTVGIAFADSPQQLVAGRSTFLFAVPIILASVLMPAWTAFLATGLCILILGALQVELTGNIIDATPAFLGFVFISLLVFLSSRSLEQALKDLRSVNTNLDRMVQERTKELADALASQRIEAGRSKAILESIADGVIVFDLTGHAIIANPSSSRLLEIPMEKILGAGIDELSQSKVLDIESRGILANLLTSPGDLLTSNHIEWGKKTISVTSAPVHETQGAHIGTVAVFRDYTPEAEVERMKNTFLAIVSHELRTPLNAILGYAEMIKESIYGPVNDKQIRASDRIMSNSFRLLEIVSDLLDHAQMEAGKLALHIRPFRPADLIENVHGVMDKIAADKQLVLTSEQDAELPDLILGDIARLQQILVNLINNGVKFTEKGSIHVHLQRSGEHAWSLNVIDTGIGIPQEDLPTIFEAFRQVDSSVTRSYGGFGLGLSIVKQLVDLMDGEINVSSQLGAGSSFTVKLPLKQAKRVQK
jgi:signal transduction histidine kinase